MLRKTAAKRCIPIAAASTLAALSFSAPPASADEVYIGTKSGSIKNPLGAKAKFHYKDKQYRSTSMSDARLHNIYVSFSGCTDWKARASVEYPGGGTATSEEAEASGCGKRVLVSQIGSMDAEVTLTIHVAPDNEPGDFTRSVSIPPLRK
ncbi:hypothetical protein G5C51_26220 [Streptomyces sp. A7024]|uniref:Lipoprotein n=1 Tax=Streptomyces coryli TaxID=1128680 RepID=A0A6G4U7M2_9ACTN|nr:hypothetical protein [Streptomyces coryli]NGN67388.1 hypothetical protein [Streptomyces coryli]